MSIRTEIAFTVDENGIMPNTYQLAGVQGDHNATDIVFTVTEALLARLLAAAEGTVYYRFDGYNSAGDMKSTVPEPLAEDGSPLVYTLKNWFTREGGDLQVVLVFTDVSEGTTLRELNSFPALLRLKNLPDANFADDNYESITTLSLAASEAAQRAEAAADTSEAAKEQTVDARYALENGAEFIFLGGNAAGAAEVDIVIDSELSEYSSNLVQNAAVAKEFKNYTPTAEADKRYVLSDKHSEDIDGIYQKLKSEEAVLGQYTPILYCGDEEITHTPEYMYGFYVKSGKVVHLNISIKTAVLSVPNEGYASISLPEGLPLSTSGDIQWNMTIPCNENTGMIDGTDVNGYLETATCNIISIAKTSGGFAKWLVKSNSAQKGWLKLSGWYVTD